MMMVTMLTIEMMMMMMMTIIMMMIVMKEMKYMVVHMTKNWMITIKMIMMKTTTTIDGRRT